MQNSLIEHPTEDEITFINLIKLVHKAYVLFKNNFIRFCVYGSIGLILGVVTAFLYIPQYKAESKFIVREGGIPGSLVGSLGGLGSLLGGGSGSSIERTAAIVLSDRIVGKALLRKASVSGAEDILINHYIKLSGVLNDWQSDSILSKARFSLKDTMPISFNLNQRKAYKTVISDVIGSDGFLAKKGIAEKSFDKKSGVITLKIVFRNEEFSIKLNELIYDELKNFMRNQASETANMNSAVLIEKVDSIQRELKVVRLLLARKQDQSIGVLFNEDRVDLKSLATKEQILLTMYGEAQKNLETVLFMGQSSVNSTNITLLSQPFSPIKPIKKSLILYGIFGFILFFLASLIFIILRRWIEKIKQLANA